MTKVIVCDIDGTVADVAHRRHWVANKPKNWAAWNAAMDKDTVHEDVQWMVTVLSMYSDLVFCSGRGEEHRAVTEKWLADNKFTYEGLYMRAERDYRQDSIVKVELLQQIREKHGEPYLWIDDRKQVVDAIRAEGVRVLQVAPGDF
jgi:HAD superfamily, subfamily IIIB (Acid phosphatase)